MTLKEFNKVRNMTYDEYVKYLQDKYGLPTKAYYHEAESDHHLVGSNISRGKEGLQCHHVREDIVASLSDKNIAASNLIEYQAPENLCYCNLLEHLFLHILIAEEQKEDESGSYLGTGGVKWMILALNSIYSDPTNSWYSKKIYNPEERGMCYDINKIITNNKDTYLALINRYCTSAFIRIKEDMTPSDIAADFCHTCKKDNNVQAIYADIMNAAKDTLLFDYNVNAYADLETYLKTNETALVKICTGGGKTTTGLEYLRVHNCKALVLGSGNTIEDSWLKKDKSGNVYRFNLDHVEYMNYQEFMRKFDKIDYSKYGVIICDEAHHIKAKCWGAGVRWALENTNVKVIGLTATPNEEQLNGTDEEFAGRICYGLDLAEGIKENNIYPFGYVQSIYKMESVKDEFANHGRIGKLLWDKLNIQASQNPVEKILKNNMPKDSIRKIIVFVQQIKDKDDVMETLIKYNPKFADENYMRFISSADTGYANKAKMWFNETNDHDVCLVSRDMINEGAHYDGVNTLIMFRSTHSNRLFLQQLGRVVVTTKKDNPNGIVFDFTNNAQTLIYRSKSIVNFVAKEEKTDDVQEELPAETKDVAGEEIKRIIEVIKDSPVIYKDYTEDCISVLSSLKDSSNKNSRINTIYSAFMSELTNISLPEELFDLDIWKDAKVDSDDHLISVSKRTGNSFSNYGSSSNHATKKDNAKQKTELIEKGQVKASDAEKIAKAFTILLRRAYNFEAIDFNNDAKCTVEIKDRDLLTTLSADLGFKKVSSIINIIKSLKQRAFIFASDIGE